MANNITLQINVSPGDVAYAHITIPALARHHQDIQEKVLIVDCCRPASSRLIDADKKFPWPVFTQKVKAIRQIAEELLSKNVVTKVYYLEPEAAIFDLLSKKYLNGWYKNTHSSGGTANMGYWAGIEIPKTKYILHYDCDILLHQKDGYNWVNEALSYFDDDQKILMAVPRLCPPVQGQDLPSLHEGRPYLSFDKYWSNDWFSTRQFLLDKERLEAYLPLVKGKVLIELLLRKYGNRPFPLDPEIVIYKSLSPKGARRIILKDENCWVTHPLNKPSRYVDALPQILQLVTEGRFPVSQTGHENIDVDAWLNLIKGQEVEQPGILT